MHPARRLIVALAVFLSAVVTANAGDRQAAERFRAAAALQERALYDLAAADYAVIEREFAADPIAVRAALARGVCLFQLGKFAEAEQALEPVARRQTGLANDEREQLLAYLGLSQYNLGQSTDGDVAQRQLDAAITTLERQLQEFPHGRFAPQAGFYVAEALYARQRLDQAAAAYRAWLEKYRQHPQRPEVLYGLAVSEHERARLEPAVAAYGEFEQEFPQHASIADVRLRHADALLALADQCRAAAENDKARGAVEQLLTHFPESANVPPALVVIAQVQLAEHDCAAAEASLDQCLRRSTRPDVTRDAYLLRARVRCERKNPTGSLADASAVLVRDPHCVEALHLRGLAESALGRPRDAAQTLARVLAADPKYDAADRVLYELAWAHEQNHDSAQAIAAYSQLIDRFPHSLLVAECQFRLGQVEFHAERLAAAATRFRAAAAAATDAALREQAIHQSGWCQFRLRDYAAARISFQRQLVETPTGPLATDAHAMAGECCFELGQFAPGLERFAAAAESLPADAPLRPVVLLHASQAAAELQDWQRSLDLADQRIREFPLDDRADETRYLRGAALLELGRLDEAHRELTRVAATSDGLVKAKAELALGRIHADRRQYDEAVRLFFKVAYGQGGKTAPESYHPSQADAILAAARTLEASGRQDAARKLYEELVTTYPHSPRAAIARKSLDEKVRR